MSNKQVHLREQLEQIAVEKQALKEFFVNSMEELIERATAIIALKLIADAQDSSAEVVEHRQAREAAAAETKTVAATTETAAAAKPAKPIIDLRALFIDLGKACGRQAQLDVLKEFGAEKLSQIDPDQHTVVAEVIQNMIKEASDGE